MTRFAMPLFALTLAVLISSDVRAEEAAASADAAVPAIVAQPPAAETDIPVIDEAHFKKIEAMSEDDRKAFFKERHEKMKNMTPEQREAHKKKRKEWFDSLPPEEQARIKEKMKERKGEHKKKMKEKWEKMSPEEKEAFKAKRKERFDSLPPEQQEKMKKRWGKKHEGMRGDHMKGKPEGAKTNTP